MAVVGMEKTVEGRIGQAAVRGALLGFVGVSIAVFIGGLACGLGAGSAAALGVFVGMWGGFGFGFMIGASISGMHEFDADD